MFARVQIDHEIDQRTLQPRARAGETNKTAAAQFCGSLHVQELQVRGQRDMIRRFA
jgi:hypothetical protein